MRRSAPSGMQSPAAVRAGSRPALSRWSAVARAIGLFLQPATWRGWPAAAQALSTVPATPRADGLCCARFCPACRVVDGKKVRFLKKTGEVLPERTPERKAAESSE